jgi:PAS domain S-box-containing protein
MTHRSFLRAVRPAHLVAGYVAAICFIAAVVVVAYRDTTRVADAAGWSAHTLRVVRVLKDLESQLNAAEGSQRGYVITGRSEYLDQYRRAERAIDAGLAELRRLTADNPVQQTRLRALGPIVAERLAALDHSADARRTKGLDAAAAIIASGHGQRLMNDVVTRIEVLERDERTLLRQRQARQRVTTRAFVTTIVGGALVSISLFAFVCFVLWWQTAERDKAEVVSHEIGRQLRLAHAANQQLMDHSLDVICSMDADGRFRDVSAAVASVWGYEREELIGKPYMDFVHPEDHALTREAARSIMGGQPTRDFENRYVRKDGSIVHVMWSATWSTVHDSMFCVARDMTERKLVEDELRHATAAAEAATRAKSAFVANMSHEIRTPLSGVLGMLDLVRVTPLSDDQARYLGIAESSARSLLTIVNDVLDLSKVESGRMQLESLAFDLDQCLDSGLAPLAIAARAKGLAFQCRVGDDVPRALVGDAGRLQQILVNLVGNAVKFTEQGEVSVSVIRVDADSRKARLQFTIKDSGIGIPEQRRSAVFEPFTQADGTTTRRHGGTGLGLTIASRLARALDGGLWLDETHGPGTTFHFTAAFELPDKAASDQNPDARTATVERHRRALHVLLAEDTESIRIYVGALLREWGHRVTEVANGLAAVDAFFAERPDLVLMDGHMPECDGLRATALIRAGEGASVPRVPIVALTAKAMNGDREACVRAGMTGYLSKPVDKAALFAAVAEIAGIQTRAAILGNLGGDEALLARLVPVFLDESARLLTRLEASMAALDREAIERLAHSLKSTIGHWTVGPAYEAARTLEADARAGTVEAGSPAWAALREELPRVRDEVARLSPSLAVAGRSR